MNPLPPSLPFTAGMVEVREVLFWSYHCLLFCSKSTYIELGISFLLLQRKMGQTVSRISHITLWVPVFPTSLKCVLQIGFLYPMLTLNALCSQVGPFLSDHLVFSLLLLELQTSAFMLDLDVM